MTDRVPVDQFLNSGLDQKLVLNLRSEAQSDRLVSGAPCLSRGLPLCLPPHREMVEDSSIVSQLLVSQSLASQSLESQESVSPSSVSQPFQARSPVLSQTLPSVLPPGLSKSLSQALPKNLSQDLPKSLPQGLIVVCGATATGKSGLGITIARHLSSVMNFDSVIISADSRQIYREFDIGSAKVMPAEMKGVPHYLVDAYDPRETVSAAMFQDRAKEILSQVPLPLLVGGTGLYIRSITHGMRIPRVAQHPQLRSQLEALGQSMAYQLLQQVDPKTCLKVHRNDRIRTVRALEVFYVTGVPMSDQQGEDPPDYPILQIGLRSQRLDDRIALRTRQMFELGFVEEVKNLVDRYGDDLPLLNTLGYQEVRQYLREEITLEEAETLTVLHTRQFAKRQKTWFNGIPKIEWFDADSIDLYDRVLDRVTEFCQTLSSQPPSS